MLFAVSGSQGSGKSSVIEELQSRGYNVMSRKISRSILSDWNVSLDEVNRNAELSLKFQDEILARKFVDEQNAVNSDEVFLTERCYMDSFVYFMYTFGSKSIFDAQINEYYRKCALYDEQYMAKFLLPFGQFDISSDGVRNSNHLYGESVYVVLQNFLEKSSNNLHKITQKSIIDRSDYIESVINNCLEQKH